MRFVPRLLGAAAFFAATVPALAGARVSPTPLPSSPRAGALVLDRERLQAFVADADNHALHGVDLSSGDVVTTPLECAPEEVLLIGDGRLAVSLRGCGKVAILSHDVAGEARLDSTIDVPAEPWGLALGRDGLLLVTSA